MFYLAQEQIQSLSLHNLQLLPSVSFLAWKEIQQKSIFFKIKRRPRAEPLSPQTTDPKEINSQFIFSLKKKKLWVY